MCESVVVALPPLDCLADVVSDPNSFQTWMEEPYFEFGPGGLSQSGGGLCEIPRSNISLRRNEIWQMIQKHLPSDGHPSRRQPIPRS